MNSSAAVSVSYATDPIAVADGMWAAAGRIVIPGDRPLSRSVSSRPDADEVFVISASRDPSRVRRNIKGTTARFESGYGWITTADCEWVADEPFAVLVHKPVRQPDDGKPQLARKMGIGLFWSKQLHKGGEITQLIPVASMSTTTVKRPDDEEPTQWVRLDILSELTGIAPYELRRGFLALRVIGDHRQPKCVFAEDEVALANGPLDRKFEVIGAGAHRPTGFPSRDPDSEVPASQVWVALSAAEGILRLISLGVKEHLDLFPTHFV